MNQLYYDMLYLTICGILQRKPDLDKWQPADMEQLYQICRFHGLEALAGSVLKNAGAVLPGAWSEAAEKSIRKNILLDTERMKLLSYMESEGIWYLPLKGIILKDLYPDIGMRQMADNDILFDSAYAKKMTEYMTSQGYQAVSVGIGTHDTYEKPPIYNFELHRSLHHAAGDGKFAAYYETIKERLLPVDGTAYGYSFTDEDFYLYMVSHAYKHYSRGGTGLRSLLDVYVYLSAKGSAMDFAYIRKECGTLGIAEFEERSRQLAQKLFSKAFADCLINRDFSILTREEQELLDDVLTSGAYGTLDKASEKRFAKFRSGSGRGSRFRYLRFRLFPDKATVRVYFPFFDRHPWLMPVLWIYRPFRAVFTKEGRRTLISEIRALRK